jgi:hypothetical protein
MSDEIIGEKWLPIDGNFYEVSDHCRVRSWKNGNRTGHRRLVPRLLRPAIGTHGYLLVIICLDGKKSAMTVHRLVAAAFIGPRPPGMQIRHLNGDKLDNRPQNLAYGTPKQNQADMILHGRSLRGERGACVKLTAGGVCSIRQFIADGWTQWFIGKLFGVSGATISAIARGKIWAHLPSQLAG